MNREQKEVLSLLAEVDEICRKNGITYFLSPQLALCGITGQPFPQSPTAGTVYMKIADMEKFRKAAEEGSSGRRMVESMDNSRRFPGFFLKYVNMDTLCFRLNEGLNYRYPGMAVTVLPLRGKIPSRLEHLWNRVEELGWLQICGAGDRAGKKKRLCGLLMRLRCVTGRGRLGRSLYRRFCSRQDRADTPEYVLRLKKKTVYFPAEIFAGTTEVELEGKTFLAPGELPLYLSRYYGAGYREKTFREYTAKPAEMVSARVSYEELFQEAGDPKKLVKARLRQNRRNAFARKRKEYLNWAWKYAKFCGTRLQLKEYYAARKTLIENFYENRDYPALESVLRPMHRAMVKSLKNDEIFAPDDEILEIYLQMLEKTGKKTFKKKVESTAERAQVFETF